MTEERFHYESSNQIYTKNIRAPALPLRTYDVSVVSDTEPEEAYQTTYGSMKDKLSQIKSGVSSGHPTMYGSLPHHTL